MESYKKMSPGSNDAGNFEHDLRIFIKKKVEMFPEIRNVIIDAMIESISEKRFQIDIASSDDKELFKEIFQL
jgi:hypothetical protein